MLRNDGDTEWHAPTAPLHRPLRIVRRRTAPSAHAPAPDRGAADERSIVDVATTAPPSAPTDDTDARHDERVGARGVGSPDLVPFPRRTSRARSATVLVVATADVCALGAGLAATGTGTDGIIVAAAMLAAIGLAGGYRLPLSLRAEVTLPALLLRTALGALVAAPAADGGRPLLAQTAVTLFALGLARCAAYQGVRSARRHGWLREAVVVVGDGAVADEVRTIVAEHPEYGLDLVDELDASPAAGAASPAWDDRIPDRRVSRMIVAFSRTREADLVDALRVAVSRGIDVYGVPRFFDLVPVPPHRDVDELWGIPLQRLRPPPVRTFGWAIKRAFDIAVSGALLVLTLPLLVIIGLAVRLTTPGPVLFRQQRVGQYGQPFDMYKFRSMYVSDWSDVRWAPDAPAVTTVGRVLRRTNLDELPQLWNVLRGHMSLVGPRPERIYFVEQFQQSIPGYAARHRVPVGVTGLAQVNGLRGDTSIPERVRFDNRYIEHWSLWRDATILTRTLAQLLKGS